MPNKTMTSTTPCKQCPIDRNCNLTTAFPSSHVMWVGLSGKAAKGSGIHEPLSAETNSGAVISGVEEQIKTAVFYKTNLVKCAPLNKSNKTRYPTQTELKCCFRIFKSELFTSKPRVVFLLGKIVSDFIIKQFDLGQYSLDKQYEYTPMHSQGMYFIPIHHPSFIRVYRYKSLDMYQQSLISTIETLAY